MVSNVFVQLSIIISAVFIVSAIMRLLKQPLIIGYIITGILVSPYVFNLVNPSDQYITHFADIGIAILLFIVGLNLNPKIIKEVGTVSLLTGIGQVIFTSLIGFFILQLLGFSVIVSIYIAIALTFSSTIIITKLLSDKGDLDSLYGKISLGFLIVQDIIAVVILMAISSFVSGGSLVTLIGRTLVQGFALIGVVLLVGFYLLPRLMKRIAKSQELLLLFSVAWCFALAALFYSLNFSLEIGALLAGLTLAISPYRYEIGSKLKPLRDFFIVMFFILLGSQMVFANFQQYIGHIILLSLFILLGNPFIVVLIMSFMGYTSRTSFMAGLTVAQISEFSFILIALGAKAGHLQPEIISFVTIIGLITFIGSTYLLLYSNKVYHYLAPMLKLFERKGTKVEEVSAHSPKNPPKAILFGYNRTGFSLLKAFENTHDDFLVVDFNPEAIRKLTARGINCMYGDADDIDFLDELNLGRTNLIVSTIPDLETGMLILGKVRSPPNQPIVIVTAHQIADAFKLYEKGADYVILPHFLGGKYVYSLIKDCKADKILYKIAKDEQVLFLKEHLEEGHEHPKHDRL